MPLFYTPRGYGSFPYGSVPYGSSGRNAAGGFQVEILRENVASAWQVEVLAEKLVGFQSRVVLYNAKRLRILCDFPSRGLSVPTGGNNAWGNLDGNGLNWLASSTEASVTNDFDVSNVNNDIVEHYWRSATGVKTGITLDCDVEAAQGVFNDTVGILGTNITSSATVQLIGSTSPIFATSDIVINLTPGEDMAWVSPELPINAYRYWRLSIDDGTNPDNFIKIGTIVFGSAIIMHGECFLDRVDWEPVNFTDSVFTEAHSVVQNDRGIKNRLGLDFRSIDYTLPNYTNLTRLFNQARTIHKCLWIPTPEYPLRFMVFGKMTRIPRETHNNKGEEQDYIDFSIEVDEAL